MVEGQRTRAKGVAFDKVVKLLTSHRALGFVGVNEDLFLIKYQITFYLPQPLLHSVKMLDIMGVNNSCKVPTMHSY